MRNTRTLLPMTLLTTCAFLFALVFLFDSNGIQREVMAAQAVAQSATPMPEQSEEMTQTQEMRQTEEMTSIDEAMTGAGLVQTALISPSQVFADAAIEPGESEAIPISVTLVKVADDLIDPINVVSARDGSGRLFVVERNGVVRIVNQEGQLAEEPFLDISDIVLDAFLEQGLYDIEFHPDFANNGRFFVHFAEVLRNGDSLEAGQNLNTVLGKLLRIDVNNSDGRPYAISKDNPFAASQSPQIVQLFGITEQAFAAIHTEARPEIWAYGLRNPWKFQFDSQTGDLYLPDVGQNHWEEINFQPADSQGGENYGWDFLMGTHCFPIEVPACSAVGVLPVAEYSHDLGCTVIGIGVYRGDAFADLNGIYFSGDYCSGRIWGLTHDDAGAWRYAEVLDTNLQFTGSGEGEDGNLYVTSCVCNYGGPAPEENPPGSLWRLVPSDQVPEGAETAAVQ